MFAAWVKVLPKRCEENLHPTAYYDRTQMHPESLMSETLAVVTGASRGIGAAPVEA